MKQLPYKTIKELEANQDIQIIDGDRGKNYPKKDEFKSTGFCVFLNASNIKDDTFVFESIDFISEEKDNLLRKGKLSRNDIIITTRGTVGLVAYYGNNIQYDNMRINSGMIIIRVNRNVINPNYFYQLLKSKSLKKQYQLFASGCAQPQLPIQDFRLISIPVFSKIHQDKIAKFLSNYDDLIENNNRRIKILEEMAQKIYKEWFVDFKFPGHETTAFKDSPLGKIPKDWEVGLVKNILTRLKTKNKYSQENVLQKGKTIVIDQSTSEYLGFHNNKPDFEASPKKPLIIFGDHTCKMQMLVEDFSIGPNVIPIASERVPIAFLYYLIDSLIETKEYKRHWNDLISKKVILPTNNLSDKFSRIITPLMATINHLKHTNMNLKQTRDILLPRLISGEIDVENMEII